MIVDATPPNLQWNLSLVTFQLLNAIVWKVTSQKFQKVANGKRRSHVIWWILWVDEDNVFTTFLYEDFHHFKNKKGERKIEWKEKNHKVVFGKHKT